MSIVNDALKKAGKEFELNDQNKTSRSADEARPGVSPWNPGRNTERPLSSVLQPRMYKKWPVIIPIVFIIMAVLFGALILYKDMSGSNAFVGAGLKPAPTSMIQSTLNNIEQKNTARSMKPQNIAKLNGIVYGGENKWAIVNDKIVKEGDSLLDGEIISITKDFVKIEKKDGSELTLSLK